MLVIFQSTAVQERLQYLIERCIYAVAFFLPLSLDASSIFLTAGALLWMAKISTQRQFNLRSTPFDGAIMLFVLLSGLSILVSPDRSFSFYNYYHLMGRYIAIYYLVIYNIQSLEQMKRLVWCLLGSSVVVVAYGFYQYIHGVDISAFEWVDGEQFPDLKMRVFSTMKNPNLLAGFLVVIMALAAGMGLCNERRRQQLLLFSLVAVLGCCLILTYSRGAWLSMVAVFAAYGVLYNRKVFWLFLVVPIFLVCGYEGVMDRLVSIANPTDTSSSLRLALWESTVAMIIDKPILGIGWGAYWLVYHEYDFFIQNAATTIYHAHNMYLHIAAEIGIPGLLIFLTIIYGHGRLALDTIAASNNRWLTGLMLGIASALLGLVVNGFTDYVMYNIQLSMLFWLLNGLVVVAWRERSSF